MTPASATSTGCPCRRSSTRSSRSPARLRSPFTAGRRRSPPNDPAGRRTRARVGPVLLFGNANSIARPATSRPATSLVDLIRPATPSSSRTRSWPRPTATRRPTSPPRSSTSRPSAGIRGRRPDRRGRRHDRPQLEHVFTEAGTSLSAGIVTGSFAVVASALDYWTDSPNRRDGRRLPDPAGRGDTLNFGPHAFEPLGLRQPRRDQLHPPVDRRPGDRRRTRRRRGRPARTLGSTDSATSPGSTSATPSRPSRARSR